MEEEVSKFGVIVDNSLAGAWYLVVWCSMETKVREIGAHPLGTD